MKLFFHLINFFLSTDLFATWSGQPNLINFIWICLETVCLYLLTNFISTSLKSNNTKRGQAEPNRAKKSQAGQNRAKHGHTREQFSYSLSFIPDSLPHIHHPLYFIPYSISLISYRHENNSVWLRRWFEWFLGSSNYAPQESQILYVLVKPVFLYEANSIRER